MNNKNCKKACDIRHQDIREAVEYTGKRFGRAIKKLGEDKSSVKFPQERSQEGWEKEFDIMERKHGWIPEHKERMKEFIATQISEAKKEVLKQISEKIMEHKRTPALLDVMKFIQELSKNK